MQAGIGVDLGFVLAIATALLIRLLLDVTAPSPDPL